MNETLKVLETRRSCRNFDKERMVSEEDIQAVVKAGTYAATGMGRQSPIIIAVTNKELRDRLSAENAKIIILFEIPGIGVAGRKGGQEARIRLF